MLPPDLSKIKAFVLDVDGVLTDGTLYCFESGEQVRGFNIKDGFGIRYAISKGYLVAVITAKSEPSVLKRLLQLGVRDVYQGSENKLNTFLQYVQDKVVDPKTVLYMGDDLPDLEVMQHAGVAACPADAAEDIRQMAHLVTQKEGGKGAVREMIEQVMRAQGAWQT